MPTLNFCAFTFSAFPPAIFATRLKEYRFPLIGSSKLLQLRTRAAGILISEFGVNSVSPYFSIPTYRGSYSAIYSAPAGSITP
ncbi:hypothetical protein BDV96DRAFT_361987 [Lophiotrema nucula]|uniref:Uncharacterized protein n=1 Tax=Lophiotrema nucula TaxID=690887 RepID=A0A6A5ZIQ7_9PLEO|nr:hypothetical protein BDV96DRAFT_361987 [Lophiotrema nucula]